MQTSIKRHESTPLRRFGESGYWGLALISPWVIGFLLFKLIPIAATLVLSFTDTYLLEPKTFQFIGFANYIVAIKSKDTWLVLARTFGVALLIIPMQTLASILIAALLNNEKLVLKNTARALFFLPSIIPSTAFMFMWEGFVNPKTGWLTQLLLGPFGLQKLNIFYGRGGGQALFILGTLWAIGPGLLILLGSIQSISAELHDAARIDGASRVRTFFSITLPLMTPAVFFTLILNLTGAVGGALLLDRGFGITATNSSFDNYIYFVLFRGFQVGAASSLAWVYFVIVMAIVIGLFWTSKRWVYYPEPER